MYYVKIRKKLRWLRFLLTSHAVPHTHRYLLGQGREIIYTDTAGIEPQTPNMVGAWLALLFIREAPDSNLGLETGYPDSGS